MREAQRRTRERVKSLTGAAAQVPVHAPSGGAGASQSDFNKRRSRLLSSVLERENFPTKQSRPAHLPQQKNGVIHNKAADEADGYDENTLTCVGVSKRFAGSRGSRELVRWACPVPALLRLLS